MSFISLYTVMQRFLIATALLALACGLVLTASAQDSTHVRQLVVQVATSVEVDAESNTTTSEPINALNARFNLEDIDPAFRKLCPGHSACRELGLDRFFVFTFESADAPGGALGEYAALSDVESVSLNETYESTGVPPNDPLYGNQWGLNNTGQPVPDPGGTVTGTPMSDIGAEKAWTLSGRGAGGILAVIDDGIDLAHPEFAGRIRTDLAWDFVYNDADPSHQPGESGHGTAVAGIAAAEGDNGIGIAGVAWEVDILPVKALNFGSGTVVNVAAAIGYAASVSDVINLSLGGPANPPVLNAALGFADAMDVVVVASSGNFDGQANFYPAAHPSVLSVGAHSPCDERKSATSCDGETWWGSTYGSIDVVAPGVFVNTTDRLGAEGYDHFDNYADEDYILTFNGTSAAAPFAAGAAILIRELAPSFSASQVKDLIRNTAHDLNTPGYDLETGHGRLGLGAAICELACPGPILYVDQSASPSGNDGSSWPTAFLQLQDALATARVCDVTEIRVAAGTYLPDWNGTAHTANPGMSFQLVDGVTLRGGYMQGGSQSPLPALRPLTILSGDLSGDDQANFGNRSDNSLHVVRAGAMGQATLMEGFAVMSGNAAGTDPDDAGGGIYVDGGSVSLTLDHLTISGNEAASRGGGLYAGASTIQLLNTTVSINRAASGAGLYLDTGSSVTAYVGTISGKHRHSMGWGNP